MILMLYVSASSISPFCVTFRRQVQFGICRFALGFPGLCVVISPLPVAETGMVRRATFYLLAELGPTVRRPRTLEPGRAHRRRLSLRCMHARCAAPASRAFKPWLRVPICRQVIQKVTPRCFSLGRPWPPSDSSRFLARAPSWTRALFVDAQYPRTRWIEDFGGMGE